MNHQIEPLLIGSVVLVVAYTYVFIEYLKVRKKDQMKQDNKRGNLPPLFTSLFVIISFYILLHI